MVNEETGNYWETDAVQEFEEVEAYESEVEDEVEEVTEEPVVEETVELRVVYSKLKYNGHVYSVGDVLELDPEEADALLESLSGRPHRHLEFVE